MKNKKHECSWETITWEKDLIFGDGILTRDGKCKVCNQEVQEVWIKEGVFKKNAGISEEPIL